MLNTTSFVPIEWSLYVPSSYRRNADWQTPSKQTERANAFQKASRANRQQHPTIWLDVSNLLREIGLTPEITGFETAEIDSLMVDFVDPERDPADELPPPKSATVAC
jgi:hypothetical protein